MPELVIKTNIKREKGYLYCCKGDPIEIIKVQAGRQKKK